MYDHICFEIQVEIIKRLPVKSLFQFRSVSKQWKSLIDSSDFVASYSHIQPERLLIWYEDPGYTGENYVSLVDDETFSQQEFAPTVKLHSYPLLVGSSHGLVCLYGGYQDRFDTEMAIIWNPSIRKSVGVLVPTIQQTVLGFGVCPITHNPTIVRISYVHQKMRIRAAINWVVEVFTLSAGTWRIPSGYRPNDSIQVTWSQIVIDNYIYWFAYDGMIPTVYGFGANKQIMSFDMTSEGIRVIELPESFTQRSSADFSISKLQGALAVFEQSANNGKQVCIVWVRDHGVPSLFTKLFTIDTPYESINFLGFTKRGRPIMETNDDYKEPAALVVYEPGSKHFNDIGIYGKYDSFFVGSYMETFLLLDQPDCKVYAEDDDDDERAD